MVAACSFIIPPLRNSFQRAHWKLKALEPFDKSLELRGLLLYRFQKFLQQSIHKAINTFNEFIRQLCAKVCQGPLQNYMLKRQKSAWHRWERPREMRVRAQKSLSLYTSTGVCCVGKAAHIPAEETRRAAIAYRPGRLTRQRFTKRNSHSGPFLQCGYGRCSVPK